MASSQPELESGAMPAWHLALEAEHKLPATATTANAHAHHHGHSHGHMHAHAHAHGHGHAHVAHDGGHPVPPSVMAHLRAAAAAQPAHDDSTRAWLRAWTAAVVVCAGRILHAWPYAWLVGVLMARGYSNLEIAFALGCDVVASFVAYAGILVLQACSSSVSRSASSTDVTATYAHNKATLTISWQRWVTLGVAQTIAVLATIVQSIDSGYWTICVTRMGLGLADAAAWSTALSVCATDRARGRDKSVDAPSMVLAFTALGALGGPWLGGLAYTQLASSTNDLTLAYTPLIIVPVLAAGLVIIMGVVEQRTRWRLDALAAATPGPGEYPGEPLLAENAAVAAAAADAQVAVAVRSSSSSSLASSSDSKSAAPAAASDSELDNETEHVNPLRTVLASLLFWQLALLVFVLGVARSQVSVAVPIYLTLLDATTAPMTIANVLGLAATAFLLALLPTARFVSSIRAPMPLALFFMLLMAALHADLFYLHNTFAIGACLFLYALCYSLPVLSGIHQFEVLSRALLAHRHRFRSAMAAAVHEVALGERVMALACLMWTSGNAVGAVVAGLPAEVSAIRLEMVLTAVCLALLALLLTSSYGCVGCARDPK